MAQIGERMAQALKHRGPDDSGTWIDSEVGVTLAHRRLSIIDLSSAGAQPMTSSSGRYLIVFNGEIYNHREIRGRLDAEESGLSWRGHSDTEVLLAGIEAWGLQNLLERTRGMFAFGLWDRKNQKIYLARDRFGEKPLYYGWQNNVFLFGSELRALRQHPCWEGKVSRMALMGLLRHNYVPEPSSIYEGVWKVPPGSWIQIDEASWGTKPKVRTFWCRNKGGNDCSIDELERVLLDAVKGQMVADVPLGAFLSGGVDSSLIVALMQQIAKQPVKTFTIGFDEAAFNEARHAKQVAKHLGTDHFEHYVTDEETRKLVPQLPSRYDEPFADSSQIPTCLVAGLAREHVKVCLTGDGGDELFGGYSRYFKWNGHWGKAKKVPGKIRCLAGKTLHLLAGNNHRRQKMASCLGSGTSGEFYRRMISVWDQPGNVVLGVEAGYEKEGDWPERGGYGSFVREAMNVDMETYLPGDILVKMDRAAMGVGLETRAPLLDHRVRELAQGLAIDAIIHDGVGKWPLRQILVKYVPTPLIERPKRGFAVPLDSWLRGPLREWAEALLDSGRLKKDGYFCREPILSAWQEHLSGTQDLGHHLWSVLMFQAWLDEHG